MTSPNRLQQSQSSTSALGPVCCCPPAHPDARLHPLWLLGLIAAPDSENPEVSEVLTVTFSPLRTNRIRLATLAILAALALSLATIASADPFAVIASVKGKVDVTPAKGGAPQQAGFGRSLDKGDKIAVAPGGAATLAMSDGTVVELAAGSKITLGAKENAKPASAPAAGIPGEVYASVTKFVAGGSRQTGLVAMSELRSAPAEQDSPFILSPRKTALLVDRPAFSWRAVPGATRYKIVLSSADQGELWSNEIEGTSMDFPKDAKALTGSGEFLLEVEARSDIKSLRKESSVFHVLPPAEADVARKNLDRIRDSAGGFDNPAARFLAGSYLSGLGLYLDATEQFGALCKLSPASPAPHEALGTVYSKIGLMDLAAAEFQQALALTREAPAPSQH